MKNPWLAAALNVVPLGLGYIYLRRWLRLDAALVGGLVTVGVSVVLMYGFAFACGDAGCSIDSIAEYVPLLIIVSPPVILAAATAQDAWRVATGREPD